MRTRALLALFSLVLVVTQAPGAVAADEGPVHVADACGDGGADGAKDLAGVSFAFNGEGLQVGTEQCSPLREPNGDWLVTFHLTGFSPEVQVTAALQDLGRYEAWSGYRLCVSDSCPLRTSETDGLAQPAGERLDGPDHGVDLGTYEPSPTTTFGYGAWPAATPVPDSTPWWAEVRVRSAEGFVQVDRVPDAGMATAMRLPAGRATTLSVTPGPATTYAPGGALRTDSGTLTSGGAGVVDHQVRLPSAGPGLMRPTDPAGAWRTSSRPQRNATLRAVVQPDGVNAAGTSAPFHAWVHAFVSLDLRDGAAVPLARAVDLRGVVRPRGGGSVEVLVRADGPGAAWSLLRRTDLVSGRADTYYRVPWTPLRRGRFVLLTRWRHGTTDDGGVLDGQSAYRRITVG